MGFTARLDVDDVLAAVREDESEVFFRVDVETVIPGVVRMVVGVHEEDSDEASHSQGLDMRPSDCRVVAKMLMAAAAQAEAEEEQQDLADGRGF